MKFKNKGAERTGYPALLWIIIILGFVIRLIHGTSYGLSNDELSALARLEYGTFQELIDLGIKTDRHPVFVQFFMFGWIWIFGNSLLVIRLPFILASTLSIGFLYSAGKSWVNKTTGLIAASMVSFTGYPILYGEIARPYAFGMLFTAMVLHFFGKVFIQKESSNIHFFGLGLGVLLSMYTHYYAFLTSLSIFGMGVFFLNKSSIWKYGITSVAIVTAYLPTLSIFLHQLAYKGVGGAEGWLGAPKEGWIFDYFSYVFNASYLEVLVVGIGIFIALFSVTKNKSWYLLLLPFWFVFAFFFGYYYSIKINPILMYSVLLFAFLPLTIFVAYGLSFADKVLPTSTLIVLFSLSFLGFTDQSGFFKKQHFSPFDLPAKTYEKWMAQVQDEKVFTVFDTHAPFYINYYLNENSHGFELYDLSQDTSRYKFAKALTSAEYSSVIYGWSSKYEGNNVYAAIRYFYPNIRDFENYFNAQIHWFSKDSKQVKSNSLGDTSNRSISHIPKSEQLLDHQRLYSSGFKIRPVGYSFSDPMVIEAHATISGREVQKAMLVIDGKYQDQSKFWSGSSVHEFATSDTLIHAFATYAIQQDSIPIEELKIYIWNKEKERFRVHQIDYQIVPNLTHSLYEERFYD